MLGCMGVRHQCEPYIPELLDDVLKGHINPGWVFDFTTELNGIGEAYAAMDEHRAIKSLVKL
jgi:threonine dehydrogenase-like Zn-dependent dehydrogenase